jgi:hypothetical protein
MVETSNQGRQHAAGVLIGGYIANRNQRKHWIADNKQAEYRRLLTILSESFNTAILLMGPGATLGPEEQRTLMSADSRCSIVMKDRIFIAEEMYKMDLPHRWSEARHNYDRSWNVEEFATAFSGMMKDIRESATAVIEGKRWFR